MAANHWVELAFAGELGEVAAELIKRRGFGGSLTATTTGHLGGFAEHADHLGAHLGQINPKVFQHAGGNAFAFADQAQEQVLRADVVVAELASFF